MSIEVIYEDVVQVPAPPIANIEGFSVDANGKLNIKLDFSGLLTMVFMGEIQETLAGKVKGTPVDKLERDREWAYRYLEGKLNEAIHEVLREKCPEIYEEN